MGGDADDKGGDHRRGGDETCDALLPFNVHIGRFLSLHGTLGKCLRVRPGFAVAE
jgi:hypothetical protein